MPIIANSFKGFETVFAGIRMFWQMVIKICIVLLIVQLAIIFIVIQSGNSRLFSGIESTDICLIRTYYSAKLTSSFSLNKDDLMIRYSCQSTPIKMHYNEFIKTFEPYVLQTVDVILKKIIKLFLLTCLVYLVLPISLLLFSIKHKKDVEDKFIRGATIVPSEGLRKLLSRYKTNEIKFKISNNISLPLSIFNRHLIVFGRPGTGKTQLLLRIINQIIASGNRAIIHDFKGDFISSFFNYKNHMIYNPLDKRHMGLKNIEIELIEKCSGIKVSEIDSEFFNLNSETITTSYDANSLICSLFEYDILLDKIHEIINSISDDKLRKEISDYKATTECKVKGWSVFSELKGQVDIDAFCASLIPESASNDNFWPISSRQILGAIITYCIKKSITSYSELWKLVNLDNVSLLDLFSTTPGCEEGAKLLTEAKTANNILAVLSNYTKPIKYLIGTEGNFSIKEWVKNTDSPIKIIFLSNYAMIQETIKPFLTMFADFSIKTLLSCEDSSDRKLFFILDEFGELGKIGTIVPMLTGSRSKGGCGILAIQDTARINSIYGKDGCSTIVNACGNLISFAVKKDEAEFASSCFGSMEIKRTEESKSMGVDKISDSISISKQTVEKRLVMPSEVTSVPDLNFYIQIPNFPLSRDALDIVSFESKTKSYIGRKDLDFNNQKVVNTIKNDLDEQKFFEEMTANEDNYSEKIADTIIENDDYIHSILEEKRDFNALNGGEKIAVADNKSSNTTTESSGRIFG